VGTGAGGTTKGFPLAPVAAIAVALAGMAGLFVLRRRARPHIG
jgi:hypothetical protein